MKDAWLRVPTTGGGEFIGGWIISQLDVDGHQVLSSDIKNDRSVAAEILGATAYSANRLLDQFSLKFERCHLVRLQGSWISQVRSCARRRVDIPIKWARHAHGAIPRDCDTSKDLHAWVIWIGTVAAAPEYGRILGEYRP